MGCLYRLTAPTGKTYIGISSKTLEARWKQHRANAAKGRAKSHDEDCAALYSAIRKYGPDAFARDVLIVCDDWDTLCLMERAAIASFGTCAPHGYNLTAGGDGSVGTVPSAASRRKMSEAQRRVPAPARARRLAALAKAVVTRAARWHAKTAAEKAAWLRGHSARVKAGHSTPESKQVMRDEMARRYSDPAYRERVAAAKRGKSIRPWTEERKRRCAEQRRAEWANPDMRAKRLAAFAAARHEGVVHG